MIRKVDYKDENYQGLTRALALGAVNGPYTEYLEGGEKAVALGEIAAEILSSKWLAELIRKEREEAILRLQFKLASSSKVQDMCPDEIIDYIPEVWVDSQPLKNCTSCEETAEDLVSTTRLGGVCSYCLEACSNET